MAAMSVRVAPLLCLIALFGCATDPALHDPAAGGSTSVATHPWIGRDVLTQTVLHPDPKAARVSAADVRKILAAIEADLRRGRAAPLADGALKETLAAERRGFLKSAFVASGAAAATLGGMVANISSYWKCRSTIRVNLCRHCLNDVCPPTDHRDFKTCRHQCSGNGLSYACTSPSYNSRLRTYHEMA